MKILRTIPIVLMLLVLAQTGLFAQKRGPKKKESYKVRMDRFKVKKKDFKKYRYITVGGSINLLTYFGDLAPTNNFFSTDISQIKPGVSAFVQYRYGPRMSVKGELLYGRLEGDDFVSADPDDQESSSRYLRNLSFRNDILDFSIMSQVYIFKNYLGSAERKFFNIFFTGGVSVFYHNPKGRVPEFKLSGERYSNYGEWVALRPLGTEGQFSEYFETEPYGQVQLSIPFGGGLEFKLSEQLNFTFEVNYRLLLTDYIDDVGGRYVDLGGLTGDMAKTMSDRSLEETAVNTGEKREIEEVEVESYVSTIDGNRYFVPADRTSIRGGSSNDTFLVTSFKIGYILNKKKSGEN